MFTPDLRQISTINAILSVFETGRIPTKEAYQTVALLSDGAGISYGKHQSTDRSGSLDAITQRYRDLGGRELVPFEGYLRANDSTKLNPRTPFAQQPDWYRALVAALQTAERPAHAAAQDEVFAKTYWLPALQEGQNAGCQYALSFCMLYDTCIHSGAGKMAFHRNRFPEKAPVNGGDEKAWITAYLKDREAWLAGSSNPLVQKTVYRPQTLRGLLENPHLQTPLVIRGVTLV